MRKTNHCLGGAIGNFSFFWKQLTGFRAGKQEKGEENVRGKKVDDC